MRKFIHFLLTLMFIVIIVACVPWMLCVKPYLMWKESQERDNGRHINGDVELGAFGGGGQQAQEDNHQVRP